ncbi:HEPN domain-containing protein [Methylobacterium radiotolerans]|uniref:DNA polymerase beta domain protein region n=1 Tax=Methylobacterium radiotolerans (strain ATCC 27329 / DSM 1819 / JCM 2831 / NBRC 15690 / NCIMB 10815 / 0-1) TaxID=426355 RepID=B1M962_METRJ|nr:HEPN domain-containing protein [Methylobacterium radiotolerans]ACB28037.1 DNA polymerase beta domain protein region [Methylobacterium radiotolerans JCM 2831]GEN01913.1 nucleotidyltransferase [Methylobacterium radiotolerans]
MQLTDRLAHLPERKQRELGHVAQILFSTFEAAQAGKLSEKRRGGRILKLILFGSYARGDWVEDHASGYRSDYDLLVVVDGEAFAEGYEAWEQAEARLLQELTVTKGLATPVNVIVHSYADVNDRLARGLPFFADIARDGVVLYEAEGFPLAAPKPLTAEERLAEARRYFEHWFPSAGAFRAAAGFLIQRDNLPEAAFQLHQTTERLYHCVLLVLTLYSPKLHRLDRLRSQAENLDARLIAAWPRETKFTRRCFARLNRAYVEARYSPHYEITGEELAWLIERIDGLSGMVTTVCTEHLDRFYR